MFLKYLSILLYAITCPFLPHRVYFNPNRPLSGIALVGMPGATGSLKITASSQIRGQPVVLRLPFQLSHCPMGYLLPPTFQNSTQTSQMISTSITQRIPIDPFQPLGCHCLNRFDFLDRSRFSEFLPSECILGYTISLSGSLWAGLLSESGDQDEMEGNPSSIPCPNFEGENISIADVQDSLTTFVLEQRMMDNNSQIVRLNFDPVDVVPYNGIISPGGGAPVKCFNLNVSEVVAYEPTALFSIEQCSQGYCQGDSSTTWQLANVSFPCAANRMGILCGQCKPGNAITLYSTVSKNLLNHVHLH